MAVKPPADSSREEEGCDRAGGAHRRRGFAPRAMALALKANAFAPSAIASALKAKEFASNATASALKAKAFTPNAFALAPPAGTHKHLK